MSCKLSVIVPVYNVEKYLEACIHSIEEQSFQDYEVILVDDGSADRSPQICDAYAERDARVRVIHSPNRGVSHARNTGIDVAKGEYLQFIDADDLLADRNVLRDMMRFTADPELDLVSARCFHFRDGVPVHSRNTDAAAYEVTTSSEKIREFVSKTMLMINIFSRDVIDELRFDTRITLGEDALFVAAAISRVQKAALLDKVCYYRRLRPGSAVHTNYKQGDSEEGILVLQLLYKELHGKPGGDALYEKYSVDQTGLINKLSAEYKRYDKEKRMIKERISQSFPHFLSNKYMSTPTKLFLCAYMVNPDGFFLLFKQYKAARNAWDALRTKAKTLR